MRKSFGKKPYTYPQPVFIIGTYDENGIPCAMNAAWGGISNDTEITLCLSAHHKTVKNIELKKEFTISMATASQMVACDYVGIASGNDVTNKFEKAGWHDTKAEFVDAPMIDELPICVECKLISYDSDSCVLVCDIINVSVDEAVLDEEGKVDIQKVEPIAFDPFNNKYVKLTEVVGAAFSAGMALK